MHPIVHILLDEIEQQGEHSALALLLLKAVEDEEAYAVVRRLTNIHNRQHDRSDWRELCDLKNYLSGREKVYTEEGARRRKRDFEGLLRR